MAAITVDDYDYNTVVHAGTLYLFPDRAYPRQSRTLFFANGAASAILIYWVVIKSSAYDDADLPAVGIFQHASSTTFSASLKNTITVPEGAVGFYVTTAGVAADVDLLVC